MNSKLKRIVNKIKDESLREKILGLLSDLSVNFGASSYSGMPIEEAPASRFHHHSYPGGLLEHTLSTINIAMAICDSIEKIYGGRVNR
ncbi:MAG: TraI domain-containing protein, partial [Candidatus Bathyarchaeia archaeon]